MAEAAIAPTASEIVSELTPAQRRALKKRQTAMFMPEAVHGPGVTLAALRRRGLIVGRQPHAELTQAGEQVCRCLESSKGTVRG